MGSRGTQSSQLAPPAIWFIDESSTFFPLRLTYREKKDIAEKLSELLAKTPQAAGMDYTTTP